MRFQCGAPRARTYAGGVTQPRDPYEDVPRQDTWPDFAPPPGMASPWPAPAGPPVQQFPSCYRHPGRPTGIGCQRCGRPICGECMIGAPVGFQCPDCVEAGMRETRQHQVVQRRPSQSATVSLIGLNVAVFVVTLLTGSLASPLFGLLALTPADRAVWQLLTSAFLHLDLLHIGFNMFALWVLGPQLETVLGRTRYLALYLVSAFAGSAFVMWFSAPNTTTVGASGALFGLMGALLLVAYRRGLDVRNILFWVGANLVFTFLVPGISWQGHLGGLVGGLLAAAVISGRQGQRTSWLGLGVLAAVFLGASLLRIALL